MGFCGGWADVKQHSADEFNCLSSGDSRRGGVLDGIWGCVSEWMRGQECEGGVSEIEVSKWGGI